VDDVDFKSAIEKRINMNAGKKLAVNPCNNNKKKKKLVTRAWQGQPIKKSD
jgi:hypothetical protein